MKKYLAALTIAAALAPPAAATTFPSLTTIYVGAGVYDSGNGFNATLIRCANVSGLSAAMRYLILDEDGLVIASQTANVIHGASALAATSAVGGVSGEVVLAIGEQEEGAVLNVESTQSGVFCNAAIVDPNGLVRDGSSLPLVRVNPHPGTVE